MLHFRNRNQVLERKRETIEVESSICKKCVVEKSRSIVNLPPTICISFHGMTFENIFALSSLFIFLLSEHSATYAPDRRSKDLKEKIEKIAGTHLDEKHRYRRHHTIVRLFVRSTISQKAARRQYRPLCEAE